MIALACPKCGRRVRGIARYESATAVVDRTCSGCHTQWRVVVRPMSLGRPGAFMHRADWTETSAPAVAP